MQFRNILAALPINRKRCATQSMHNLINDIINKPHRYIITYHLIQRYVCYSALLIQKLCRTIIFKLKNVENDSNRSEDKEIVIGACGMTLV